MTALLLLAFSAAPPPALFAGRVLDAWRDDLNSPDALVAEEACLVLTDIGPLAAPARGGLRRLLNHPGRLVRLRAALALWRIGRDPTVCLPVIGDGLRGGDLVPELLDALNEMGRAAAPTARLVFERCRDADVTISRRADRLLANLRELALPTLLDGVRDARPGVRRAAAALIVEHSSDLLSDEHAPVLRTLLADRDPRTRTAGASLLFGRGEESAGVYSGLALALTSADASVRHAALRTIGKSDARPDPLLPALIPLLDAPDPETRLRAAHLVYEIEQRPARVLPVYDKALDSRHQTAWTLALPGIARLGPAGAPLAPRLVGLLGPEYRETVGLEQALSRIGHAAVPLLVPLLVTPPASNRDAVLEVVYAVLADHPAPTVARLGPLLESKDDDLPHRLIELVGRLGPDAGPVVPKLLRHLGPGSRFRIAAAQALVKVGPAARAATDALGKLAASPGDVLACTAALHALASIGLDAERAAGLAAAARKHPDARVRAAGLVLLSRRAPADPALGPALLEALDDRETLATALSVAEELGPAAAPAVPRLIELLDGPSAAGAAEALAGVGPAARPAVPALLKLLRNGEAGPGYSARLALAVHAGHPEVIAAVVPLLAEQPERVLSVLAESGRAEAIAPVVAALRDRSTRWLAGYALSRLDPERARREAALRELAAADGRLLDPTWVLLGEPDDAGVRRRFELALGSRELYRRGAALSALGLAGPRARGFLPRLRAMLDDAEPLVRAQAAVAVWQIAGDATEALPVVRAVLKVPRHGAVRRRLAVLLAAMGPRAKPAASALRELLDDPDRETRLEARRALAALEGKR